MVYQITAKKNGNEYELTGETYKFRSQIKDHGAYWTGKIWVLPIVNDNKKTIEHLANYIYSNGARITIE